jgi:hypothetical protein
VSCRLRTRIEQPVGQPVQHVGESVCGSALGQLELPLPPVLLRVIPIGPRGHLVVREFRQLSAIRTEQLVDGAVRRDTSHRCQGTVAHDRQHHVLQLGRRLLVIGTERCPYLGACIGPRRQLQVPARVGSASSSAQCDLVRREIAAGGVVVDGVERLRRRPLHTRHRGETIERRCHRRVDDVELALNLKMPGGACIGRDHHGQGAIAI